MESWIVTGKDPIDLFSAIVSAVGFPLTILSIVISNRNTQRSIDVQIITTLAIEFHRKWDEEWRTLLLSLEGKSEPTPDSQTKLYSLLNWIDWLGVLVLRGALKNLPWALDTIGLSLLEVLAVARSTLNDEGRQEWIGVFEIARRIGALDESGRVVLSPAASERIKKGFTRVR